MCEPWAGRSTSPWPRPCPPSPIVRAWAFLDEVIEAVDQCLRAERISHHRDSAACLGRRDSEADAIYESVRTICHYSETQPAPTVYRVLGNLKGATGDMLAQALNRLAAGLERSLAEYDVYEDDGRDPAESVASAAGHMRAAGALAEQIGT